MPDEGQLSFVVQDGTHTEKPKRVIQEVIARENVTWRADNIGVKSLSTLELLSLVTGDAEAAANLLASNDIADMMKMSCAEMTKTKGIGRKRSYQILAALELGRRSLTTAPIERTQIRAPADAGDIFMADMQNLTQEELRVMVLDTRNRILAVPTIYKGSLNTTWIRTAEVFKPCISRDGAAIIVAHNHPSGDPSPSSEDISLTKEIINAGKLLDIEVLDHLIIGHQRFISLRERGLAFE